MVDGVCFFVCIINNLSTPHIQLDVLLPFSHCPSSLVLRTSSTYTVEGKERGGGYLTIRLAVQRKKSFE
eukprot:scaffold268_cov210-Ochromonas_danica.AAC.53